VSEKTCRGEKNLARRIRQNRRLSSIGFVVDPNHGKMIIVAHRSCSTRISRFRGFFLTLSQCGGHDHGKRESGEPYSESSVLLPVSTGGNENLHRCCESSSIYLSVSVSNPRSRAIGQMVQLLILIIWKILVCK
jgi:hypothetical protein